MRVALLVLSAFAVVGAPSERRAKVRPAERTTWDSVFTRAQAARGEATYARTCSRCHQATLTGADQSPALVGSTFLGKWDGLTVGQLHDRIRTTMPSGDPGIYTRAEVSDVIAYILDYNEYPAGIVELPTSGELLGGIRILESRPRAGGR